jgi:osmotically-inducible protein OsmY
MSNATASGLTRRVDSAILDSPHLKGCTVHVELRAGCVVLHGQVGSYYQKQIAQEVARVVEGVDHIDNRVVVRWPEATVGEF